MIHFGLPDSKSGGALAKCVRRRFPVAKRVRTSTTWLAACLQQMILTIEAGLQIGTHRNGVCIAQNTLNKASVSFERTRTPHTYHTYVRTYMHACTLYAYMHTCYGNKHRAYLPICLHAHISTYLLTCLLTYIPTYTPTYIPTYPHTYIPIYIYMYVRTCIHTYHECIIP